MDFSCSVDKSRLCPCWFCSPNPKFGTEQNHTIGNHLPLLIYNIDCCLKYNCMLMFHHLKTYFETFLNAIPVSVVETPLVWMTPACLNHLSDWLSLMVEPSADLSPNLENSLNFSFSCALSEIRSSLIEK